MSDPTVIKADVRVVRHLTFDGAVRYLAAVTIDGRPTSFDCSHLHHSERAADKCLRKVRDDWDSYLDPAVEVAPGIWELTKPGETWGTCVKRYHFPSPEDTW